MEFDNDDFYINDDDLADCTKLSIIDNAKLTVLTALSKSVSEMTYNVKLQEGDDALASLTLISRYVSNLTDLTNLADEDLSDAEITEKVDRIMSATTELTLSNIDDIIKTDSETITTTESDDDDNSHLDF